MMRKMFFFSCSIFIDNNFLLFSMVNCKVYIFIDLLNEVQGYIMKVRSSAGSVKLVLIVVICKMDREQACRYCEKACYGCGGRTERAYLMPHQS